MRADVSERADVEALIRPTVETYGRLDCAHDNAGIEGDMARRPIARKRRDRTIAINLKGVWLCMKYEIRRCSSREAG